MGGTMSPKEQSDNSTVVQLQKLHRRRMAIFGSIILIAGIAIGAALTVILIPWLKPFPSSSGPPLGGDERMVGHLVRVLDLTPEQEKEILLICKTAFATIHDAQATAKPKIDKAITTMNKGISGILTEEQNKRWQREINDFQRRFGERWRRGGRRGGEGRGGPGRRRGSGEPDRMGREPGRRSVDPDRMSRESGRRMGDPNRPRRGPGPFGPGFGSDSPGEPRGGFDREAMRERYRRGDDLLGRRPRPDEPNRPPPEAITEPKTTGE